MDNSNKIVPPHLNAEVYRTDTSGTSTQPYLDYIRINTDGTSLIGCSELTGRYWNGGASICSKWSDNKTRRPPKKDIYLTSGSADGCFIERSNKVLLGDDNGALSIWTCNADDAWDQWNEDMSVAEHDGGVMAMDCLTPGNEYVTVGADGNIKVWDISDLICARNYIAAHSKSIYGVSVRPQSGSSFATGSLDYYASLWDGNVEKPVLDLTRNDCGIRCLQWLDEYHLFFGDEAGALSLIDIRNPENVTKLTEFPAAIHKICVQPECDRVSVCCDNKILSVFEFHDDCKLNLIYENSNLHSNYIRGMAWDVDDKNVLHTVGWDGETKIHKIST
ncbi:methylosome protein 50-like [Pararge aegeria]|uniref:methylosome protein 50-like n=1 Tax=Pararge aegeria TaxID=116150 RepID=UPI0019D1B513|nr:methylosome protein 50-like [Pararge aegeria]XP_039747315.1 methylosome protein 50-like [Pararge aegeria]XP_039747316.1 methylosome protein 50-like [Pararge aegeria]